MKVRRIGLDYYSPGGAIYDVKGSRVGWLSPYDVRNPWSDDYIGAPYEELDPAPWEKEVTPTPSGITVESYGVGTGQSEGVVSGKKDEFLSTERVYAAWKLSGDVGGKTSSISWYRKENGSWAHKWTANYTAEPDWTNFWHQTNWLNMGDGEWKIEFKINGETLKTSYFTYGEITPPAIPVVPEETVDFWIKKGYTSEEADLIAAWVVANQQTPSPEKIQEIISALKPPEKTWWEKLLALVTSPILLPYLASKELFQQGYKLLTGREMTDAEFAEKSTKIADWILPINLLLKLFTGKNLKGEPEEFGSASDWIEASIYLVGALIPGQVDETAAKFGLKSITKTQADELVARMGEKKTVEALIKAVKANPTTSAKLLSKFPKSVIDAVFSGLYKTAWGREAVYTLGKTGFYKYSAPAWKKAISFLMDATKPIIAITLPIFAATEIPNLFNMMQFSRKQRLEAEGKWPSDIAYKLNDYEDLIKSYMYDIDRNIQAKDKARADELLKKLIKVIEDYKNYINEKKDDMLPENYDIAMSSLELFNDFVSDRTLKIAELPVEAPPEEEKGILNLSVEPADAEIEVAGQPNITSAGTFELAPGSYVIKASKEGYWDKSLTALIKSGEETNISIVLTELTKPAPPLPPEEVVGTLKISVIPEDALIEVAGHPEITTSGTYTLTPGSYAIRVSKEGYETQTRTIIIKDDKETEISITLSEITPSKPEVKKATITITSAPTNADIYINGEYKWTTTPYTVLLEEGNYFIRVQKEGYYPVEVSVEIEQGETSEIPFTLEKIPEPEVPPEPYIPQTPYYPTYTPPEPYIPPIVSTPITEVPPYDYSNLWPEPAPFEPIEPTTPPVEKELLVNIETTDVMPTEGRIYSIAFLDLSSPLAEIQIAVSDDEETLIRGFLEMFEAGMYKRIVGYNVAFDYRYIFAKMMKYRVASKAWKNAELRDIMQIMKQVKEEFVFNFNKPGTLDEWGKALLGKGKYGSQELMLRKYIQGDFDYVRAFQNRQIELTRDLYNLIRFCIGEAIFSQSSPVSAEISPISAPESVETTKPEGTKQCPTCFAFQPLSATKCDICGASI